MTPEQALHTFARRYCIERAGKLSNMRAADHDREFYTVGPRSIMLRAILLAVELYDFDQLPRLDQFGTLLVIAGETARRELAGNSVPERDEQRLFADAVRSAALNGPPEQQPLPYRRTLSVTEVDELCRKLRARWGFAPGYSNRREAKSHPSLRAFDPSKIDEAALQLRIREFLNENEIRRILELREAGGENYCHDAAAVEELSYAGAEGFDEGYWTSEKGDWIVYCDESTITLGGSIAAIAPPEPSWDGVAPPVSRGDA
jgi:hypothetical protein